MKYIGLILFLMGATSMLSYSQRFEGGVLGGLNASQVDGDTYGGYNKPGIVAGAYLQTNLSPTIFTGMELKFAQKGSRKNPNPKLQDDQEKYIMRLNYIDLPVYLGYRTSEKIAVLAGFSAGYLVSGTEFNNYGKFVEEDRKPFNEFDVQAMLGFRFQFTKRLFVDLRGAYSVSPVREKPGNILWYWDRSQFNNVLNTTVLYRLDF